MLSSNCISIFKKNKMESTREKIEHNARLRQYLGLINKIVKVEYKTMAAQHLVEFDELINIGIQTIDVLFANKEDGDEVYTDSYLTTAIKWAIRNELRRRYRWHGVKYTHDDIEADKNDLREAIYKTILSTDEMLEQEKPIEVKDLRKNPEEAYEFEQMSLLLRKAISELPKREKELIEGKFFKEKKLMELSEEFSISASRISRIIKSGLDKVRDYLIQNDLSDINKN